MFCAVLSASEAEVGSTLDEFRIFAFAPTKDDLGVGLGDFAFRGVWAITNNLGVTDFVVGHLRDGTEIGRQVPTLKIYRQGAIYGLAIIDEKRLQAAAFLHPRILMGDILVFEVEKGESRRVVKIPLIWRPESKMIFAERRGVEWSTE